jgi:uncharacterized protein YukE
MSTPQTEVDAWRGAADVLVEAMGLAPEPDEPAPAPGARAPYTEALGAAAAPKFAAPVEQTASTQQTEAPEAPEIPALPDYQPVDLDELDLDDDEEETVTSSVTVTEDDPDEYADPETQKLRAQLRQAQKALDNERSQRVASNTAKWRQKYKEMYPLADIDSIEATSRRSFERAAAESHNKSYRILEPQLKALQAARDKILAETRAEAKSDAAIAYGKPVTGPGAAAAITGDAEAAIVDSRKTAKSLADHFRTMLAIEDKKRGGE